MDGRPQPRVHTRQGQVGPGCRAWHSSARCLVAGMSQRGHRGRWGRCCVCLWLRAAIRLRSRPGTRRPLSVEGRGERGWRYPECWAGRLLERSRHGLRLDLGTGTRWKSREDARAGEMGPALPPHHLPSLGLPAGPPAAPTLRAGVSLGSAPQRRTAPTHRVAEHPLVPAACPGTVRPHGTPAQTRRGGLSRWQRRHHAAPGQQTASRPRDPPLAGPRVSRSRITRAPPLTSAAGLASSRPPPGCTAPGLAAPGAPGGSAGIAGPPQRAPGRRLCGTGRLRPPLHPSSSASSSSSLPPSFPPAPSLPPSVNGLRLPVPPPAAARPPVLKTPSPLLYHSYPDPRTP